VNKQGRFRGLAVFCCVSSEDDDENAVDVANWVVTVLELLGVAKRGNIAIGGHFYGGELTGAH
jgi:hypothetical protein